MQLVKELFESARMQTNEALALEYLRSNAADGTFRMHSVDGRWHIDMLYIYTDNCAIVVKDAIL